MMYFLHHLSDRFIGFNVFLYVTFRAIAAAVSAFLQSVSAGVATEKVGPLITRPLLRFTF